MIITILPSNFVILFLWILFQVFENFYFLLLQNAQNFNQFSEVELLLSQLLEVSYMGDITFEQVLRNLHFIRLTFGINVTKFYTVRLKNKVILGNLNGSNFFCLVKVKEFELNVSFMSLKSAYFLKNKF